MKTIKAQIKERSFVVILSLLSISFLSSYSITGKNTAIEYMSITVYCESKVQRFIVEDATGTIARFALLSPYRKNRKKKLEKAGFKVIVKEIKPYIDNVFLISLLEDYGEVGWELSGQNIGIGDISSSFFFEDVKDVVIGQYFLSRKIND